MRKDLWRRICRVSFAAGMATLGILAGCTGQPTPAPEIASDGPGATRDPAVFEIIATEEEALGQARQRIPTAILRQVDFGPEPDTLTFRFTDAAATRTLSVTFTGHRPDNGRWRAIEQGLTPLTGLTRPGMEIGALRTSPVAVLSSSNRQLAGLWPSRSHVGWDWERPHVARILHYRSRLGVRHFRRRHRHLHAVPISAGPARANGRTQSTLKTD